MIEVFIWIIVVLFITTLVAVIAKKHGVEYLIGTFVALVVISNILANKIVVFLEWVFPAVLIAYSITFFVSNIINEFYSEKQAKKTVMIGFLANILLVLLVFIAIRWPSASFWNNQEAFALTLGNTWRIVLGSLIAYIVSQNYNIWSFNLWKKVTKGRYLWLRNTLSTILSQLIDTIIFVFIAFYGLFPVIPVIIGLFIVKVIIALLDNPFIYFVRWVYRKI